MKKGLAKLDLFFVLLLNYFKLSTASTTVVSLVTFRESDT